MTLYDVHAVAGSDGDSGLPGNPWKTMSFAVTAVSAGDTIRMRGGPSANSRVLYNERISITAGRGCKNGTASNPIVVTNFSNEYVEVRITAGSSGSPHTFYVVRNWWQFRFQPMINSVHPVVINLNRQGSAGMAWMWDSIADGLMEYAGIYNGAYYAMVEFRAASRIIAQYNSLWDNDAGAFNDASGFSFRPFGGDVDDCEVRYNTIWDMRGDCVVALPRNTAAYWVNRPIVASNVLFTTLGGSSENGADFKNALNGVVEGNYFDGWRYCSGATGGSGSGSRGGEALLLQENGGSLTIRDNVFKNMSGPALDLSGLNTSSSATVHFYRNKIFGLAPQDSTYTPSVFYLYDTGMSGYAYIYKNTVFGRHGTTGQLAYHGALSRAVIQDNGFIETGPITEDVGFLRTYDYNGWYLEVERMTGANDVILNPQLVNASNYNFAHAASSPWVDEGVAVSPYTDSSYNLPDIGWYEYVPTPTSIAPSFMVDPALEYPGRARPRIIFNL